MSFVLGLFTLYEYSDSMTVQPFARASIQAFVIHRALVMHLPVVRARGGTIAAVGLFLFCLKTIDDLSLRDWSNIVSATADDPPDTREQEDSGEDDDSVVHLVSR